MIKTNPYTSETTTYWNIIKNVKDEVKIRLITLLSESLSRSVERTETINKNRTNEFIKKFYGAWKGSETAEDIIAAINSGKTSKDPVSFD